ncbi:hypothetical protein GJ744_004801 [Endocarpon pusillum]|uniref:Uncharacterized protein n=1 Tax=Endocarpon pusillum TaxID=364733 RepID=A0A8H7ACV2_9EURO|nr:hypothetical protein GJ744_004801 [Endocarpon pusillum]
MCHTSTFSEMASSSSIITPVRVRDSRSDHSSKRQKRANFALLSFLFLRIRTVNSSPQPSTNTPVDGRSLNRRETYESAYSNTLQAASWRSHLGAGYRDRYQRTGAMTDLKIAIQRYHEALDATPADHPDRANRLGGLGVGYRDRYQRTEAMTDLEMAIQQYQEALDTTPADHPDRAGRLQDLGIGYHDRYQRTGAMTDLEMAIQRYQEALDHSSQTQLLELECDASKVCGLTYTIKDTQDLSLPQPEFLIANITDFIRRLRLSGIVAAFKEFLKKNPIVIDDDHDYGDLTARSTYTLP